MWPVLRPAAILSYGRVSQGLPPHRRGQELAGHADGRVYPGIGRRQPAAYQGLSRPAGAGLRPTSAPPTRAGIPGATAPQEGPGAPPGAHRVPPGSGHTPGIGRRPPAAYQSFSRPAEAGLRPTSVPPTRAGILGAAAPQEVPGAPPGTRRVPPGAAAYPGIDREPPATYQGLSRPAGAGCTLLNTGRYPRAYRPTGRARSATRHSLGTAGERAYPGHGPETTSCIPGPQQASWGQAAPHVKALQYKRVSQGAATPQEGPGAPPGTRRAPLRGRDTPYTGMDYPHTPGPGETIREPYRPASAHRGEKFPHGGWPTVLPTKP